MRIMRFNELFYFEDMIGKRIFAKRCGKKNDKELYRDFGIVVDETANTLVCSTNIFGIQSKVLIKHQYIFRFHEINESGKCTIFEIPGSLLVGLPEHRIKSIRKKRLKVW